ncbi:MAG: hypothetical protein CUN55_07115 [Phototrophicales bacterium]|nr:MAG: hypothetical protein CUN55_07115 [Phototrophicales bacterium]
MSNTLRYILGAVIFALIVAISGGGTSLVHAQTDTEAVFVWPEAGLRFNYPADWQQLSDPNADFVLVAPLTGDSFAYMAMQSGLYDASTESVGEIMASFVENAEDLSEFSVGEVIAYRFTEASDDLTSIFVGFTADEMKVHLINLTVSNDIVDEWLPVFEQIIDSMTIEPLALDHEILNAQLQANFEETGRLIVGELDAPTRIYEFLDFACPHCVDYHDDINRLVQDQVLSGNANLQFGTLTFVAGQLSRNAAAAQVCAAKLGVGWDVHNLLFETYRFDGRTAYEVDAILANIEAAELDVDIDEFAECMNDEDTITAYLGAVQADAVQYGVSATPTMLFASADGDFGLLVLSNGQEVSRANLNTTYDYIAELAGVSEE